MRGLSDQGAPVNVGGCRCKTLMGRVWRGHNLEAFKFKFLKNKVLAKQNTSEDTSWSPVGHPSSFQGHGDYLRLHSGSEKKYP